MNWLEALFHVSPDGGSGLTELLLTISGALTIALLVARRSVPQLLRRPPIAKR